MTTSNMWGGTEMSVSFCGSIVQGTNAVKTTPTCPGIWSEDMSVNGVWKSEHKYIKARTILASTHSKRGQMCMSEQAHAKQRGDMAYTPLHPPHRQSTYLCNMSKARTQILLSLCNKNVLTLMGWVHTLDDKYV